MEVCTYGTLAELVVTLFASEGWSPYLCGTLADYADDTFGLGAGIFFKYHEIADQGHGGNATRELELLIERDWAYERPILGIRRAAYRQIALWEGIMDGVLRKFKGGKLAVPEYSA